MPGQISPDQEGQEKNLSGWTDRVLILLAFIFLTLELARHYDSAYRSPIDFGDP